MTTVDGKILSANWGDPKLIKKFSGVFETYHETFKSEAWMCGRITMEKDFSTGKKPDLAGLTATIEKTPFIGNGDATSFAIAIDPQGKLDWDSNQTGRDHIVEVLTHQVSDAYLQYLQQKGISYIFAGETEIDFHNALSQLGELFPIKTIMLEGGGHLNGSLLNDGLIDELSLMLLPVADGTPNTATVFDVSEYLTKNPAKLLILEHIKQVEQDVVWLKYRFTKD